MKINRTKLIKTREKTMKGVFLLSSIFSIFALLTITGFLVYSGIPAAREIGIFKIIFGKVWNPSANATNPTYGIVPFILGSLYVTILSTVIGVPIGLFTSIFLYKFCHKKLVGTIRQLVNLLASIPSVIFGLFGMIFFVPFLQRISPTGQGEGILAASIILSIMILPTIVNISLNALHAIPDTIYEGALALGATKEQAVFKVVFRAAKNGVFTSVVLAIGRAIGETIAVVMVIGLNNNIPKSIFVPANTMTAVIASEVMESGSAAHFNALMIVGIVLFLFTLILNIAFSLIRNRGTKDKKKAKPQHKSKIHMPNFKLGYSKTANKVMKIISYVTTALSVVSLLGIILFVLVKGLPHINLHFIFGKHSSASPTLRNALVGTFYLIIISIPIAVPIGIGAAIFLAEYAPKSRFVGFIRVAIETLAAIPSIVYGLFGYAVFVVALGWGKSLLGGGITLSIMILPTIIRTVEESLLSVPSELREGAFALGAGKVRTIFRIVLPSAMGGIVSSFILSVGRVVAECAMLILTIGMVVNVTPTGAGSAGTSLALNVFYFVLDNKLNLAAAASVVLLAIVIIINLGATLLGRLLTKGREGKA